jgi:hypothetical protein
MYLPLLNIRKRGRKGVRSKTLRREERENTIFRGGEGGDVWTDIYNIYIDLCFFYKKKL